MIEFFLAVILVLYFPGTVSADEYTQALSKIQQREFGQAEALLKPLVESGNCRDAKVYHLLGTCQARLGEPQRALQTAEEGIGRCGRDDELEKLHAWLIPAACPLAEAEARLRSSLIRQPDSLHYRRTLAQVLMRLEPGGREAEQLLVETSRLATEDLEAHFLLGQWYCLNNRDDDCIRVLHRALRLNHGNDQLEMQAYTMIAMAEQASGRIEEAREAFGQASTANSRLPFPSSTTTLEHVRFLRQHGPTTEARQQLHVLLEREPGYAPALLEQARLLAQEGKNLEAVEVAQRALTKAGDDAVQQKPIRVFLARTLFLLKRSNEAAGHQEWIREHP